MNKYVIIANNRARQALQVGPRLLASKASGGKSSCRIPVAEFQSSAVRSALVAGRIVVLGYSDDDTRLECEGATPSTPVASEEPAVVEATPAPAVEVPVAEPTEEAPPSPEVEAPVKPEPAPETSSPADDLDAYEEAPEAPKVVWTREALEALPYNGEEETTLIGVAKTLGIKGRKAEDIIGAILASQEGA